MTLANDFQTTISKNLFSHSKPLAPMTRKILGLLDMPPPPPPPPPPPFDIKDVIWRPFCFQNKAKISLRHTSLAIYIFANLTQLPAIF